MPATEAKGGRLSFIDSGQIPFQVKRAFWIYDIDAETSRGGHAHINAEQILVCLQGHVKVELENVRGDKYTFDLQQPNEILYFPQQHWLSMKCDKDTILLVLASNDYSPEGYIRDYGEFKGQNDSNG